MGKYIEISNISFENYSLGVISTEPIEVIDITSCNILNASETIGLSIGSTFQFQTSVSPLNATDKRITYTSSNTGVVTVTSSGLMTVIGAGNATVTARSVQNPNVFDEVNVLIEHIVEDINVTYVTINEKIQYEGNNIEVGSEIQLTSTIFPPNATNKSVFWEVSDTNVATINSSGLLNIIAEGEVTVKVTSQENISIFDSVTFTAITNEEPVDKFTLVLQPNYSYSGTDIVVSPSNGERINVNVCRDRTRAILDKNGVDRGIMSLPWSAFDGLTPAIPLKLYNSDNKAELLDAIKANIPYVDLNVSNLQISIGMICWASTAGSSPAPTVAGLTGLPNGTYKVRFFINKYSSGSNTEGTNKVIVNSVVYPRVFKNGETILTAVNFCEDMEVQVTDGTLYIISEAHTSTYTGWNLCEIERIS